MKKIDEERKEKRNVAAGLSETTTKEGWENYISGPCPRSLKSMKGEFKTRVIYLAKNDVGYVLYQGGGPGSWARKNCSRAILRRLVFHRTDGV